MASCTYRIILLAAHYLSETRLRVCDTCEWNSNAWLCVAYVACCWPMHATNINRNLTEKCISYYCQCHNLINSCFNNSWPMYPLVFALNQFSHVVSDSIYSRVHVLAVCVCVCSRLTIFSDPQMLALRYQRNICSFWFVFGALCPCKLYALHMCAARCTV